VELTIDRNALNAALSVLAAVASKKSPMAILQNVLMRCNGKDSLVLAASDLSQTVVYTLPCESSREGGITLPAKQLADMVASVTGDEVRLSVTDLKAEIKCGRSRFSLTGLHERDFPKLPDTSKAAFAPVDAVALCRLIDLASYAICPDLNRPGLGGAELQVHQGDMRLCAAGGHRGVMARCKTDLPNMKPALIPKTGLALLKRAIEGADGVQLAKHSEHVMAKTGTALVCVKLLDADFPPLESLIRKESPINLTVPREALQGMVKRAGLLDSRKEFGVKLTLERGTLTASSESSTGSADESLPIEYKGKAFEIGVSAVYLAEALDNAEGEEVVLELAGELEPLQLKPVTGDGFVKLVMPMRV